MASGGNIRKRNTDNIFEIMENSPADNEMENERQILHPELLGELWERFETDQEVRKRKFKGLKENMQIAEDMQRIDAENTARLHEIVNEYGWPTVSMVGERGSRAAFFLIQHADHDLAFQQECLEMMIPLADLGEARKRDVAFLTDRVRVGMGAPYVDGVPTNPVTQVFGTQFHTDEKGNFGPWPIEDRDNLDERRREYGLEPFSEYVARMEENYADDLRMMNGKDPE